jgi:hypothetical protein
MSIFLSLLKNTMYVEKHLHDRVISLRVEALTTLKKIQQRGKYRESENKNVISLWNYCFYLTRKILQFIAIYIINITITRLPTLQSQHRLSTKKHKYTTSHPAVPAQASQQRSDEVKVVMLLEQFTIKKIIYAIIIFFSPRLPRLSQWKLRHWVFWGYANNRLKQLWAFFKLTQEYNVWLLLMLHSITP